MLYQFLTPAEAGSWSGGHDEGRLAEGVTTTLCTTQQVMLPGDGKICCGMTARRPALRPDLVAATSVLMGSSVGSYALMCAQLLMLRFSVSEYVFPSMTSFCHSPQEPFFAHGQGPKRGCVQSDERQPQPDGGTDRRQSYNKTKGHGRRETKTPNATRQAPLAAHPLKLKVQEPIPSSKNLNLVQVDKLVQDRQPAPNNNKVV